MESNGFCFFFFAPPTPPKKDFGVNTCFGGECVYLLGNFYGDEFFKMVFDCWENLEMEYSKSLKLKINNKKKGKCLFQTCLKFWAPTTNR